VQARADAASERGRPACLITMEFCHFTVRHTGWAIDCFYMTRRGELYQGGRTGGGGGLWNRKEPIRAYPAVSMARCLLVAAAQLQLTCGVGGYVGIERKKLFTGKMQNVYCNNDSRTST